MCVKTTGLRPKKGGMKTDRAETENGSRTAMKEEGKLAAKGSKPHKGDTERSCLSEEWYRVGY